MNRETFSRRFLPKPCIFLGNPCAMVPPFPVCHKRKRFMTATCPPLPGQATFPRPFKRFRINLPGTISQRILPQWLQDRLTLPHIKPATRNMCTHMYPRSSCFFLHLRAGYPVSYASCTGSLLKSWLEKFVRHYGHAPGGPKPCQQFMSPPAVTLKRLEINHLVVASDGWSLMMLDDRAWLVMGKWQCLLDHFAAAQKTWASNGAHR